MNRKVFRRTYLVLLVPLAVFLTSCAAGGATIPFQQVPTSRSLLVVLLDRSGSLIEGSSPTDPYYDRGADIYGCLADLWAGNVLVVPCIDDTTHLSIFGPSTLSDLAQEADLKSANTYNHGMNVSPMSHSAISSILPTTERSSEFSSVNKLIQGSKSFAMPTSVSNDLWSVSSSNAPLIISDVLRNTLGDQENNITLSWILSPHAQQTLMSGIDLLLIIRHKQDGSLQDANYLFQAKQDIQSIDIQGVITEVSVRWTGKNYMVYVNASKGNISSITLQGVSASVTEAVKMGCPGPSMIAWSMNESLGNIKEVNGSPCNPQLTNPGEPNGQCPTGYGSANVQLNFPWWHFWDQGEAHPCDDTKATTIDDMGMPESATITFKVSATTVWTCKIMSSGGLNIQAAPTSQSSLIRQYLMGTPLNFVQVVDGENVNGNSLWGLSEQGHCYWLSGTDQLVIVPLSEQVDQAPSNKNDIVEFAKQIAGALSYIHSKGIIHGDVKPENTPLNVDSRVLLTDFGSASLIHRAKNPHIDNIRYVPTSNQGVLDACYSGTSPYTAPERSDSYASQRSDQDSLVCVAYELLTGELPFRDTPPPRNGYQATERKGVA